SHAEIVFEKPLQYETASHGIEGRENKHRGFGHRVEDPIEEHENYKEDDGENEFQALPGTQFKFIFTGPLVGVSRRQPQLLRKQVRGLLDESPVVGRV